jgi:signal transduction histidine kinase/ActR/RegA family two-component response regulator
VCVLVGLIGVTVVVGWVLDVPSLQSLHLPGPILKTNAAICLACVAIANLIGLSTKGRGWAIVANLVALVPLVVGALTLSQHVVGWNLHIDELFATEPAGALATMSPNRMGPPAALIYLLLGVSLLLADRRSLRKREVSEALALLSAVIALLPLIGFAYGFSQLYLVAQYTGIAFVTTVCLLLVSLSVPFGRPQQSGLGALVCRDDEVGVLSRRFLLAGLVLPFGMGWALARLLGADAIDGPFALSAMALLLIVSLAALIWRTGRTVTASMDARAAAERALTESEKSLREADRQKSEFLATLSHELRNPLAPMRFAVELLQGPPAVAEHARQTIERQVRHLTRLVDDLLDLTRISRNKLALAARPGALKSLVADAVDAVAGEAAQAGLRLAVALPSDPIWINVDPERFVQMIVNLLTNAVRYSNPGETVFVEATADASSVSIAVRDTGAGIAAEDLNRVFDRFVQIGNSRHAGLGLGLALVKTLAELHGGSVEAKSAGLGHGAEFIVRLPRASAPAGAAPAPVARRAGPPCRILVVDDNRDAAEMLAMYLRSDGHEVRVAADGHAALTEAAAFRPEVALLDIGMPGLSGYDVARTLRRDPETASTLLVAITGWGQDGDRRLAMAAGFDAHLTKPADPAAISVLLNERARRRA